MPPPVDSLPLPPAGRTGWPWEAAPPEGEPASGEPASWPAITIVTPSFQQGEFLEATIRSILLQGYPRLEYIICDGGSTDRSLEILRKYEPWLAWWVSERDGGQTCAINKGLRRATGDIVAFLNSDDWYHPGALRAIGERARAHPEENFWAGWVVNRMAEDDPGIRKTSALTDLVLALGRREIVHQPGVFWRRAEGERLGWFDENLHYAFDHEYFLRLHAGGCRLTNLAAPIANFRLHGASKSCSQAHRFAHELRQTAARFRPRVSALEWSRVQRSLREAEADILVCNAYGILEHGDRGAALRYLLGRASLLPYVRPARTYFGALARILTHGHPPEWYRQKSAYQPAAT